MVDTITGMRREGMTYAGIALKLNTDGIAGPHGGTWFTVEVRAFCLRHGL